MSRLTRSRNGVQTEHERQLAAIAQRHDINRPYYLTLAVDKYCQGCGCSWGEIANMLWIESVLPGYNLQATYHLQFCGRANDD